MIDFLRDNGDISFNGACICSNSDYAVQVKQRLTLRLQRFLGEWFLDTTKGIDFFTYIKVKNPNIEVIDAALKNEVLKESAVKEIVVWESTVDARERIFKILPATKLLIDTGNIIEFGATL